MDERLRELENTIRATPDDGDAWFRFTQLCLRAGEPIPYEAVRARLRWLVARTEIAGVLDVVREAIRRVAGEEPWLVVLVRHPEAEPRRPEAPNQNDVIAGLGTGNESIATQVNAWADDQPISDNLSMQLHGLAGAAYRRASIPFPGAWYPVTMLGVEYQPPQSGTYPRGSLMTGAQAKIFCANMVNPGAPRFFGATQRRVTRPNAELAGEGDDVNVTRQVAQVVLVADLDSEDKIEVLFLDPEKITTRRGPAAWLAVRAARLADDHLTLTRDVARKFAGEET